MENITLEKKRLPPQKAIKLDGGEVVKGRSRSQMPTAATTTERINPRNAYLGDILLADTSTGSPNWCHSPGIDPGAGVQ